MDPVLDPVSEDPMARRESQRACQNAARRAGATPGAIPTSQPQVIGRRGAVGLHSGVVERLPLAEVHAVNVGTRLAGSTGYGQRPSPADCRKIPRRAWRHEYRIGNCVFQ